MSIPEVPFALPYARGVDAYRRMENYVLMPII